MKLFIQFNESETEHLQKLEAGQKFGTIQQNLELEVYSTGEMLRIAVDRTEGFVTNSRIHLACEIPKDKIRTNENIGIFMK